MPKGKCESYQKTSIAYKIEKRYKIPGPENARNISSGFSGAYKFGLLKSTSNVSGIK